MVEKGYSIIDELELDGLLISYPASVRYLSGFSGEGYLLIGRNISLLFTDARYTLAAKAEASGFEVIDITGTGYDLFKDRVRHHQFSRIGYEDNSLTCYAFSTITSGFAKEESITFIPLGNNVARLRSVKEPDEIGWIEKAEAIGDYSFSEIIKIIKPGMTEKEVAAKLEYIMKSNGADGLSFDTIVAAGENGAKPHAVPTNRLLREGDMVVMDFGCCVNGYCSDMTRTIVLGTPSKEQREVYDLVERAGRTVMETLKPGMSGREIDGIAREMIKEAGYGPYFSHSLGHSVGLDIHEIPNFSSREESIILPGMVITVEPGVYLEGKFGVRIEDVVVITEEGCRDITKSKRELIQIHC